MKNKGLGKGFGSLLPSNFDESLLLDKKDRVQKLLIQDISPHPEQPRKSFDKTELEELASSIKRHGILQPIVVMPNDQGYLIIAGERRYRAAILAGLEYLPALVRSLEELERLEIALVENVQRVDLSPLEQARSIAKLNLEFNLSLDDIATRLGKAQSTIINNVRLLQLPDFARQALENRQISEGHARSILSLKDMPAKQSELLDYIIKHSWSVRQAEQFAKDSKNLSKNKPVAKVKSSQINLSPSQAKKLENLQKKLGRNLKISIQKDALNLKISYSSPKDLEKLLDTLGS